MSVDVRTRMEGPVSPVDAAAWLAELPALAAAAADRVVPGATELTPRPVTIVVDGETCCSLSFDDGAVVVSPGVASERRWLLTADELTDVVHDVQTPMSFLASGRLAVEGGVRLEDTLDWWVILRAILDGQTVHTAGAVTFEHELGATFQADASDDELGAYLQDAGYLHVAGVFTEEEMAEVSADMDAAAPTTARATATRGGLAPRRHEPPGAHAALPGALADRDVVAPGRPAATVRRPHRRRPRCARPAREPTPSRRS